MSKNQRNADKDPRNTLEILSEMFERIAEAPTLAAVNIAAGIALQDLGVIPRD